MISVYKRVIVIFTCIIICLPCHTVMATTEMNDAVYTYGNFQYTVNDNRVTITGYYSSGGKEEFTELVIPSRINGMKVVSVKKEAFDRMFEYHDYWHKVNSIVCSDYMTTVNMSTFNYIAYDIKKITLGKFTKKFYQYGKWDYDHGWFRLEEIVVPKDNKFLKTVNGAVYSKDGTILWAFPAGREQASFRVSSNTTTIAKYAFYWPELQTITLPDGLTSIQKNAFYRASKAKIKVPSVKLQEYKAMIQNSGIDLNRYEIKLAEY